MNPRQKMNEKEIHDYNMRLIQHNFYKFDKLEDFSMHKIFTVIHIQIHIHNNTKIFESKLKKIIKKSKVFNYFRAVDDTISAISINQCCKSMQINRNNNKNNSSILNSSN